MSALFRRISWQQNIDRFLALQAEAKALGFKLTVKNANTRRLPVFLFYLDRKNGKPIECFADLDEVLDGLRQPTATSEAA